LNDDCGGIALINFCRSIGISRTTGWNWRRRGWLRCVDVNGKLYVERAEINRFWERARNGEFQVEKKAYER
jgi:hypothetical protein